MNHIDKVYIVSLFLFLIPLVPIKATVDKKPYKVTIDLNPKIFRSSPNDSISIGISGRNGKKNIGACAMNGKKITFSGNIEGDSVAYMMLGDNDRFTIPFIIEPGEIIISMNGNLISASGTPLNNTYNKYYEELMNLTKSISEREKEIKLNSSYSASDKTIRLKKIRQLEEIQSFEITKKYCIANKDNAISALIFNNSDFIRNNDINKTKEIWKVLGDYVHNLKESYNLYTRVINHNTCHEGMQFPDFYLKRGLITGEPVHLSDIVGKGKYILVDFWASWCMACRAGIPYVKAAYNKFHSDNFDCLSICVWDKWDRALNAINEEKMPWKQLIDVDGISGRAFGISAIPQLILFSPDGKIIKMNIPSQEVSSILEKELNQ